MTLLSVAFALAATWSGSHALKQQVQEGSAGGLRLYCFMHIHGQREIDLVKYQKAHKTGIFACDTYDVFSATAMNIDGLTTIANGEPFTGKIQAGKAYENVPDFIRIWDHITSTKKHDGHDFVVKLDPDTVIMMDRLIARVREFPEQPKGFFFRNWVGPAISDIFGLLGPVEVFSHNAVAVYAAGQEATCQHAPFREKNGEDGYMKNCLEALGAEYKSDLGKVLLHNFFVDTNTCSDTSYIAFHPLKTVAEYDNCFQHATNKNPFFEFLRKSETPDPKVRDKVEAERHMKFVARTIPFTAGRNPLLNGGMW